MDNGPQTSAIVGWMDIGENLGQTGRADGLPNGFRPVREELVNVPSVPAVPPAFPGLPNDSMRPLSTRMNLCKFACLLSLGNSMRFDRHFLTGCGKTGFESGRSAPKLSCFHSTT